MLSTDYMADFILQLNHALVQNSIIQQMVGMSFVTNVHSLYIVKLWHAVYLFKAYTSLGRHIADGILSSVALYLLTL